MAASSSGRNRGLNVSCSGDEMALVTAVAKFGVIEVIRAMMEQRRSARVAWAATNTPHDTAVSTMATDAETTEALTLTVGVGGIAPWQSIIVMDAAGIDATRQVTVTASDVGRDGRWENDALTTATISPLGTALAVEAAASPLNGTRLIVGRANDVSPASRSELQCAGIVNLLVSLVELDGCTQKQSSTAARGGDDPNVSDGQGWQDLDTAEPYVDMGHVSSAVSSTGVKGFEGLRAIVHTGQSWGRNSLGAKSTP
jgi:hypothetical protein